MTLRHCDETLARSFKFIGSVSLVEPRKRNVEKFCGIVFPFCGFERIGYDNRHEVRRPTVISQDDQPTDVVVNSEVPDDAAECMAADINEIKEKTELLFQFSRSGMSRE